MGITVWAATDVYMISNVGHGKYILEFIAPKVREKYNINLYAEDTFGQVARAKLLAERSSPTISLLTADSYIFDAMRDDELIAELDPNIVTNMQDLLPGSVYPDLRGCIFVYGQPIGIVYNTEVFKKNGWAPPKSWKDLFRAEFKGRVSIISIESGWGVAQFAAWAKINGGDENNVEPAFTMVKALLPYLYNIHTKSSMLQELLAAGEVWVGVTGASAVYEIKAKGVPVEFVIPEEGCPWVSISIGPVKGGRYPVEAQLVINELLSAEFQSFLASKRFVVPANMKAAIPPELEPLRESLYSGIGVIPLDWRIITQNLSQWLERWKREIIY
ncbi:MAG: extracellular solute-binding protein [Candidatus Bathyarchaeia archaeon]